jgi:hypothetical protein
VVDRLNRLVFTDVDIEQVLGAMRRATPILVPVEPADGLEARAQLQRRLTAGEMILAAFSREWRRLERPQPLPGPAAPVDELRLRRALRQLKRFGELWADPAIPSDLRQEAIHELFDRIDVQGPEVVALHPQPNENAWLLGYAAMRDGSLTVQHRVGMVGARGVAPSPYK